MGERVWERFLTEQDKAHLAVLPRAERGWGQKHALLLVDLYRWVFGDRPQPLLEAIEDWPASCGLAAWQALPRIQELIAAARQAGIPVIHITGLEGISGWSDRTARDEDQSLQAIDRRRRRYDIVGEVAPIESEVVIHKSSPSAFWGTPLVGHLNRLGVDTLIVAGESTSGCVRATVVDAKTYRYNVIVVEECVFDRHEAAHAINLFDMDQKYANVLSVTEVVRRLVGERVAVPALA